MSLLNLLSVSASGMAAQRMRAERAHRDGETLYMRGAGPDPFVHVTHKGEAGFRGYVLGVARNLLFAYFRGKRKQAERFDPLAQSVVDLQASFTSQLARRREEEILLQALRSLPLDLQIVFELYHLEGLTAGQLAAMHGISEPGMYGRLRKARLLTIAACERLAETPALRKSTIDGLDDWARELRGRLGQPPG